MAEPRPVSPFSLGDREAQIERLRGIEHDLVVVGGGITGAGIAWDAAARGLRVALVERADFAGGTSSRSSKLIHGGLRYLAQGRVGLTREAVAERGRLQRLAPHLVELLPFLFPIYHGPLERAKLTAGLWAYDTFAAGSGAPRHSWLDTPRALAAAPGLEPRGLSGAFVYPDARTDDARLVMEVLRAAVAHGAVAANYVAMQGLLTAKGRAIGVAVEDRPARQPFEVRGRVVVVAAGVWLDEVLPAPRGKRERIRPAKGVHLVLDSARFPSQTALYLSTTGDNRLVFVIPWLGRTLVGTTDTAYDGDLAAPRATAADVDYLLDAVRRAFPERAPTRADVLSSQAGLRPLVLPGGDSSAGETSATAALSREDRVFETDEGVIAIAGGKLTTFRRMAQKVVDLAASRLTGPHGAGASRTATLPLAGFERPLDGPGYDIWLQQQLAGATEEVRARRTRLIQRYGAHHDQVEALIEADPQLGEPLAPGLPALRAEAAFAVHHEQAQSVGDVLAQRLRLALLAPDQGAVAAVTVAELLGRTEGWSDERRAEAVAAYEAEAQQYAVPGPA